jgi:hypothetical protein
MCVRCCCTGGFQRLLAGDDACCAGWLNEPRQSLQNRKRAIASLEAQSFQLGWQEKPLKGAKIQVSTLSRFSGF